MLPKFDVLTDEQIDKIHKNSMKILQEIGVEFSYDPAIEVFKKHGQRVEGHRVYFDPDFVENMVEKAPSQFTLHARNPEHNLVCGAGNTIYMPGYGAPFIYDADGGKPWLTMTTLLSWPVPVKTSI